MFSRPAYTFIEDDVIGTIEVVISGPVREDTEVFISGGTAHAWFLLAVGMGLTNIL